MASKVLVIENDPTLGDALVQKLRASGYEVQLESDGAAGFKKITEWHPHLLLLDITLPTMSGYDVLEAKAKDPVILGIPVIVVSNSGQPVEISRVVNLGVKDYLVKADLDPDEVVGKVQLQLSANGTAASALQGKMILVIEDDSFLSYIVSTKLQHHGVNVVAARSAEEAYAAIAQNMPQLVLLDLILGAVSGFEVLEKLKRDPATASIPVIVLSNLNQQEDIDRCKKLGAVNYLVKANITPDAIIQEINAVLLK